MAFEAEQREILKMVQAGQITPEDGARLLSALTEGAERASSGRAGGAPMPEPPLPPSVPIAGGGRWFKLQVEEPSGQRVNITLPARAVPLVLRFAARWVPSEYRDVLDEMAETVATDFRGELLNVEEPSGERVKLWIE